MKFLAVLYVAAGSQCCQNDSKEGDRKLRQMVQVHRPQEQYEVASQSLLVMAVNYLSNALLAMDFLFAVD